MFEERDEVVGADLFGEGPDLPVGALSNDRVVYADPGTSIREAAVIMNAEGIGLLLLESEDRFDGVVSERDIMKAVATDIDLDEPATTIANEGAMHRALASTTVGDVAGEMMEGYVRHVVIVDDEGSPAGVVSVRDLLAVIAQ